jgi:hypothetical protein
VLLDEQQVVFKSILAKVAEARDLGTKASSSSAAGRAPASRSSP